MRKYQALWHQLRDSQNGILTVAANPILHRRIKKAVAKEKWKDTSYKIQWDMAETEQPVLYVSYGVDMAGAKRENCLTFRLVRPVLLTEL
jgi:hypothetical protein